MVEFLKVTLMHLRNSSKHIWTHTVILAIRARHQISPRFLVAGNFVKFLSFSHADSSGEAWLQHYIPYDYSVCIK